MATSKGPQEETAAGGGGGGGEHSIVDPIKGKLPKIEKDPVVPPMVQTVDKPKLAVDAAIDVQKNITLPDNPTLPNIGVKNSPNVTLASNGGGSGGGMGSGYGGGLGSGNGNGYGPGPGGAPAAAFTHWRRSFRPGPLNRLKLNSLTKPAAPSTRASASSRSSSMPRATRRTRAWSVLSAWASTKRPLKPFASTNSSRP